MLQADSASDAVARARQTVRMKMRSAALGLVVAMAVGCGGGQQSNSSYSWVGLDEGTGTNVSLSQGAMPANHTFTGVYRSPQIGDIEIVQTGDSNVGRYEFDRGSCHVRGRLEGSASGNLFRFTWTEDHRECGRIEPVRGRGYFLYHVEEAESPRGRLFGKWGYREDDHGGGAWTAFKIAGRQPRMLEDQSGAPPAGGAGGGAGSGGSGGGS